MCDAASARVQSIVAAQLPAAPRLSMVDALVKERWVLQADVHVYLDPDVGPMPWWHVLPSLLIAGHHGGFAARPFEVDSLVALMWGSPITLAEFTELVAADLGYHVYCIEGKLYDARTSTYGAQQFNASLRTGVKACARLCSQWHGAPKGAIAVRASRYISAGEEILVNYGSAYWTPEMRTIATAAQAARRSA